MEINLSQTGETMILSVVGELNYKGADQFNKSLEGLEGMPFSLLELDLGQLDFVDSLGMGLFVKVHDLGEKKGFRTVIRNAKGRVLTSLKMAQFTDLFDIK